MKKRLFGGLLTALAVGGCAGTPSKPVSTAVTLQWSAVNQLTDHTALTDLAGYRVSYALAGGETSQETVAATSAALSLTPGHWTFSVAAVSASRGVGEVSQISYTVP